MKQRIRKTLLVTSFLLFPVTIWYFSPYLIIQAASRHIMNGSFLVFSAMLVLSMFLGKNDVTIHPFYMTDHGISISSIYNYVIYYGVLLILVLPALLHGRRASCHYICWMAPFMVLGSALGRLLHLPQLHIEADRDACISCGKCNKSCPMGLDVKKMVADRINAKCTECIQCGACVHECPWLQIR